MTDVQPTPSGASPVVDMVLGLVRHSLTPFGGALVTEGVISSTQLNDAVGAVMVFVGIAWSLYQKRSAKKGK